MLLGDWTAYWAKRRYVDGVFGQRTTSYHTLNRVWANIKFMRDGFGDDMDLDEADDDDVHRFIETVGARRKKPLSFNEVIATAKVCFSDANRRGRDGWRLNGESPLLCIQSRTVKKELPRFLSLDGTEKVMQVALGGRYILIALCLFCGLRRREVERLHWRHVRDDSGQSYLDITAEIAKGGTERRIPLPDALRMAMGQRGAEDSLITDTSRDLQRQWRAVQEATIELHPQFAREIRRCTVHGLRHSCTRWLHYRGDVTVPALRDFLGHSNIQTTMRYLEGGYEGMREVIQAMGINAL